MRQVRLLEFYFRLGRGSLVRLKVSRLQRRGLRGSFFCRLFAPLEFFVHPFTHVGLVTHRAACGQLQP
jgi:hypothetical protein